MKRRDPRINARSMGAREYLLTLVICNLLCAALIRIYTAIHSSLKDPSEAVLCLFVAGYVIFVSAVLAAIFVWWRRYILSKKVDVLGEAARRVASGDYGARIPPQRTDGKRDEFEVLYEDFNSMAEQLEGKTILREDFLSNASHEFRTPLSVINNYITILQSGTLSDSEWDAALERIRRSSAQLSDMVGNVLHISRFENRKVVAEYRPYNLSEQLAQTILSFDQMLNQKHIHTEVAMDDDVWVTSDEGLMRIVWNNLLSNAVKFTPEGGGIFVEVLRADREVRVTVRDSGCGIAAEDMTRIFEKFYQADSSHATSGNGLGLALVKNIAGLLDCGIDIKSTMGEGTAFTVSIPERKDK